MSDPVADRAVLAELVLANHILAREGVLDGFGHVSIRHPEEPGSYLISRSLSPENVTAADVQRLALDGERLGNGWPATAARPTRRCPSTVRSTARARTSWPWSTTTPRRSSRSG